VDGLEEVDDGGSGSDSEGSRPVPSKPSAKQGGADGDGKVAAPAPDAAAGEAAVVALLAGMDTVGVFVRHGHLVVALPPALVPKELSFSAPRGGDGAPSGSDSSSSKPGTSPPAGSVAVIAAFGLETGECVMLEGLVSPSSLKKVGGVELLGVCGCRKAGCAPGSTVSMSESTVMYQPHPTPTPYPPPSTHPPRPLQSSISLSYSYYGSKPSGTSSTTAKGSAPTTPAAWQWLDPAQGWQAFSQSQASELEAAFTSNGACGRHCGPGHAASPVGHSSAHALVFFCLPAVRVPFSPSPCSRPHTRPLTRAVPHSRACSVHHPPLLPNPRREWRGGYPTGCLAGLGLLRRGRCPARRPSGGGPGV
jgi:hypothetical protein